MDKLTQRDGGQWYFVACSGCIEPPHCHQCKEAADFAFYENVAQEKIVIPPYQIGDVVYLIHRRARF